MSNWQKAEEAVGSLRKLVQDLVAPEVSGLRVKLDTLSTKIDNVESHLLQAINSSREQILLEIDNRFLREENERLRGERQIPPQ